MLTRSRPASTGRARQAFVHRRKHGLTLGVDENHSTNERQYTVLVSLRKPVRAVIVFVELRKSDEL